MVKYFLIRSEDDDFNNFGKIEDGVSVMTFDIPSTSANEKTYYAYFFEGLESNPITVTVGGGGGGDEEEFCANPSFEVKYTISNPQGETEIKFVDVEHIKGTLYIDNVPSTTYAEITSSTTMPVSQFDNSKTYIVKYRLATGNTSIPAGAFAGASSTFVESFNTNVGTTSCPIDRVDNRAFANCINLTGFTLGSSIESLGDEVFNGCDSLQIANIPSTLEIIGMRCFYDCQNLKYVNIGDEDNYSNLSEIGNGCFNLCPSIEKINLMCEYPPIISNGGTSSDGSYAFTYSMQANPHATYPIIVPCGSVINYQINNRPNGWIDSNGHEGSKWDTGLPCWMNKTTITTEENKWHTDVLKRLQYDGTTATDSCKSYVDRGADRVRENVENCGDLIFDLDLSQGQAWQTMQDRYWVFFSDDNRPTAQNCSAVSINGLPSMPGQQVMREGNDEVAWLTTGLTTVSLFGWNDDLDEFTLNTGTGTDNRNYKPYITRVVVNGNIIIGERALCDMNNLRHVDVTKNTTITTIPAHCFRNDINLTTFDCGNHVSSVYWSAFDGCDMLSSVTIGTSCANVYDFDFLPDALVEIHLKSQLNTNLSVSDFEANWDLSLLPDMASPQDLTVYCHGDAIYNYYNARLSSQNYTLQKV